MPSVWRASADTEDRNIHLRLVEMEPSNALPALDVGDVDIIVDHNHSTMPPGTAPNLAFTQIATEAVLLAVHESQ